MYLYNVSIIVEDSNHQSLIEWVKTHWLPQIRLEAKFLKMLNTPHEGFTYCVQIVADDNSGIEVFQQEHVSLLQQHIQTNHMDKAFVFDSIMEYITE